LLVDFKIAGVAMRLNKSCKLEKDAEVCVVYHSVHDHDFIEIVKKKVFNCKRRWPSASIIIISNIEDKYNPHYIKEAELAGYKMINRKMGDKLARELGAVKYLEMPNEYFGARDITWFDEVTFASLGKINDEKEKRESTKNDLRFFKKK